MATGDPVFIKQIAKASTGVPPYFSYTTTVDFAITGWTCAEYHINFGTWVDLTSGIYKFLYDTVNSSPAGDAAVDRKLLEAGDNLTATSNNNNRFGLTICGFEL